MSTPVLERMREIVTDTLGLGARGAALTASSPLLGTMPELDSFAIVQLTMAIETQFDITIADDDFGSELFATLGSLAAYVEQRVDGGRSVAAE